MELVQRLRQRYLQFLQVVVDVLTDEVSYRDFEDRLRQELDAAGAGHREVGGRSL